MWRFFLVWLRCVFVVACLCCWFRCCFGFMVCVFVCVFFFVMLCCVVCVVAYVLVGVCVILVNVVVRCVCDYVVLLSSFVFCCFVRVEMCCRRVYLLFCVC